MADLERAKSKSSLARIDTLPVSVVEIGAQDQQRRDGTNHAREGSRAMFSHFPSEVGTLAFQLFLRDADLVFDPFAGWGERAAIASQLGRIYKGYDISDAAIAEAYATYGVENTLADSATAPIPAFDGLLTCPPYWNLEQYGPNGLDRIRTWAGFLAGLEGVFRRCYDAASPGAVFCILVGDWRSGGVYYDLTYQVQRMFHDFGARTIDIVIANRLKVTKVKILIPQAIRLGYTVKVHETLYVCAKP